MAENKTKPTAKSVPEFLEQIEDHGRKEECLAITGMMQRLTGSEPRMWGDSIVGFGTYKYKYASGREGEWFRTGFSPRKQYLTIYVMGYLEFYTEILANLGKFKHGKGCLYIRNLKDIDMKVLEGLIKASMIRLKAS